MSHFTPTNGTSLPQVFRAEAAVTPSPSKFSSTLEITDSEAESDSDDEMDDSHESDQDSEESVETSQNTVHSSPANGTSFLQGSKAEASMTHSPSRFSSTLEIPYSEAESDSDDEMDDGLESEDEDSEHSVDEEDGPEDDSEDSEDGHEERQADVEMRLSGVEKDIETETEQASSPISFKVDASNSLQVPKLSFKELQKQRQQIIGGSSKYESTYVPTNSTTSDTGKSLDLRLIIMTLSRKIRDLEKRKSQIEADIEDCENDIEITQQQIISQQVKILLEHNGISQELMDEYERFRATIESTSGQRSGCSITCFGDHRGSYVKYDPSFELFKSNVEDDYEGCHYRCEASKVDGPWKNGENGEEREKECIVEFWPVPAPVLKTNGVATWGKLFPLLYQLAIRAARNKSEAALDMLVALPDQDASACGEWLFDYEFDPAMKNHAVISKRWRFRGSYLVNKPVSTVEKRKNIEYLLGN